MKYLTVAACDDAIEKILAKKKTMLRRVLSPQPPEGSTLDGVHGGIAKFNKLDGGGFFIPLGYDEGDECFFRETWGVDDHGNFLYRARGDRALNGWNRILAMPPQAARAFIRIKSIRVERLHDITMADAKKEGCPSGTRREDLPHWWTSRITGRTSSGGGKWKDNPWVMVMEFAAIKAPNDLPAPPFNPRKAKTARNSYRVTIRATGELVCEGTAEACAIAMNRSETAFWEAVRKARNKPNYRYAVETTQIRPNTGANMKKQIEQEEREEAARAAQDAT